MQALDLINSIPSPPQDLKRLAFCAGSKKQAVAAWSHLLRPTQVEKTSGMLYEALPEIARLKTTTQSRIEILELLRPFVQHAANGLTKHYITGSLSMAGSVQKSAIVSQALQKHMIDAYIVCARELIQRKKTKAGNRELGLCIHRAITGIGLLFLRNHQMYTRSPSHFWRVLHTLFNVADMYELLDTPITDEEQQSAKVCSIQDAYMTTVLLDSVRPHQLGQKDMAALYDVFRSWAHLARFNLGLSDDPNRFFCIHLNSDYGPIYKTRALDEGLDVDQIIELDFGVIIGQLSKQREDSSEALENMGSNALKVPKSITPALLDHILDTWGNIAQRKQERRAVQTTADFCTGISDCHFFVAGSSEFDTFLSAIGNPEKTDTFDVQTFTSDYLNPQSSGDSFPTDQVEILNSSQGGFCIQCDNTKATKVQAGNMIGLRQFGKKQWSIGAVRWIRQKSKYSQLGIKIISDKAEPYALAYMHDMGGYSDYMRAFYLPPDLFTKTPDCIVVGGAPLDLKTKIRVFDGADEFAIKLDDKLYSTANIQVFSFHDLEGKVTKAKTKSSFSNW